VTADVSQREGEAKKTICRVSHDLSAWKRALWRKYPKCTMAAKLNTLKSVWWLCRLM